MELKKNRLVNTHVFMLMGINDRLWSRLLEKLTWELFFIVQTILSLSYYVQLSNCANHFYLISCLRILISPVNLCTVSDTVDTHVNFLLIPLNLLPKTGLVILYFHEYVSMTNHYKQFLAIAMIVSWEIKSLVFSIHWLSIICELSAQRQKL